MEIPNDQRNQHSQEKDGYIVVSVKKGRTVGRHPNVICGDDTKIGNVEIGRPGTNQPNQMSMEDGLWNQMSEEEKASNKYGPSQKEMDGWKSPTIKGTSTVKKRMDTL